MSPREKFLIVRQIRKGFPGATSLGWLWVARTGEGRETFEDEASRHGRGGSGVTLWLGDRQLRAGPWLVGNTS